MWRQFLCLSQATKIHSCNMIDRNASEPRCRGVTVSAPTFSKKWKVRFQIDPPTFFFQRMIAFFFIRSILIKDCLVLLSLPALSYATALTIHFWRKLARFFFHHQVLNLHTMVQCFITLRRRLATNRNICWSK